MVYNQQHQLAVAKQVSELIESKQDIKLLVVNNLTKFFKESKNKNYAPNTLKEALGTICRICARNKIALVCTGDANVTSKGVIPRPIGGTFLKHSVNVIVHLRECSLSHAFSIQGHINQTSIRKNTQICSRKHKENRTHLTIRSMISRWEE